MTSSATRVLVLGGAVSGRAAAWLARSRGHDVEVYDRRGDVLVPLREKRIAVHSGVWSPRVMEKMDLVVTSPGIAEHSDPIQAVLAAGIPLWSEVEYASRDLDVPFGAVTGTNGKTTVTRAAANMLERSGKKAFAAGNIGTPLSGVVGESWDALVVETSSFQLRFIDELAPRVAVLLNVAPDHLIWHGSLAAYTEAKRNIFRNQSASDLLVYDADDLGATAAVEGAPSTLVPVSGTRVPVGGNGREDGVLVIGTHRFPAPDLDASFTVDLVAAATLALELGATEVGVAAELVEFVPDLHRRTVVGTWDGVTWIDDSKATNPHAAVAAISAHPSVVLIAGGRNKGLDLRPIVEMPGLRAVVAIGEAAQELADAGGPRLVHIASNLPEAVATADGLAKAGDTVLLAPGCASFDMFASYGERGDRFTDFVLDRKGNAPGGGGGENQGEVA